MDEKKPKRKTLAVLGIVMLLMLSCIDYKGCGKSRDENLQDYQATTFYAGLTQTAQALPGMAYPLFFKGAGSHNRDCLQEAEITFFVPDSNSCRVSVDFPLACAGPLAEGMGASITFRGTVTERDNEPSYCELTTCPTGDASGTVYFNQLEMVGDSVLTCPGDGSTVEFGPLERQEGSAEP